VLSPRRIAGVHLNQALQKGNCEFPASDILHLIHPSGIRNSYDYVEMYVIPQQNAAENITLPVKISFYRYENHTQKSLLSAHEWHSIHSEKRLSQLLSVR
jgi:hypothetical protein